ncbi:MAG TPA: twin-arginine translocase TatA/TatE family subunit [Clostridia bacterium]|nr:twin-arginine translocase TatA/TatE family subunit [Clostridia bacterium]
MFGRLGTQELLLLLGLALVIFGPGKLPEIGKSFGKAIGEFKNHATKISQDVEEVDEEKK